MLPSEICVARVSEGQFENGSAMMLRNASLVSVTCETASSIRSAERRRAA